MTIQWATRDTELEQEIDQRWENYRKNLCRERFLDDPDFSPVDSWRLGDHAFRRDYHVEKPSSLLGVIAASVIMGVLIFGPFIVWHLVTK